MHGHFDSAGALTFTECYSRVFYHDVHDDHHHRHAHPHRGVLVSDGHHHCGAVDRDETHGHHDAQCGPIEKKKRLLSIDL